MCFRLVQELVKAGALRHLAIDIEDVPDISPLPYEYLQAVQYQDVPRILAALAVYLKR